MGALKPKNNKLLLKLLSVEGPGLHGVCVSGIIGQQSSAAVTKPARQLTIPLRLGASKPGSILPPPSSSLQPASLQLFTILPADVRIKVLLARAFPTLLLLGELTRAPMRPQLRVF